MAKHIFTVKCWDENDNLVETLTFDSRAKVAIFFENGAVFGLGFTYTVSHALNVF